MATLVSPGVEVQVIDESINATAGPGTIPLIFIATAQDKPLNTQIGPVVRTVAPGTTKENANELYLITSQRELVQTFGDPRFYTEQGTPIPAYELNEYGLLTAYQYLGIANRAWVVRGDVDLAGLEPTEFEPRNEARSGSYWFDLSETAWGLFRSNGNAVAGSAWNQQNPIIIDSKSETETVVIGDVGFDSGQQIGLSGTLTINGVNVSVAATDTIPDIAAKVNSASISNVRALALKFSSNYWLTIRNTASESITIPQTPVSSALGFDDLTQITQPAFTEGSNGDTAVMPYNTDNLYFEKIRPTGRYGQTDPDAVGFWFLVGSSMWKLVTPTTAFGVNESTYLGNPVNSGDELEISDGVSNTLTVTFGSTYGVGTLVEIRDEISDAIAAATLQNVFEVAIVNTTLVIVNLNGESLEFAEGPANSSIGVLGPLGLEDIKGNQLYYAPHYQIPAGSVVGDFWIRTTEPNGGVDYVVKQYSRTTQTWTTIDAPFFRNDDQASASYGTQAAAGSLYVQYNLYGDDVLNGVASHLIRRYTGSGEVQLVASEIPGTTSSAFITGDQFVVVAGQTDGTQDFRVITLTGNTQEDLVTDIANSGLLGVTADIVGGYVRITNVNGFSLQVTYVDPLSGTDYDSSNSGDPLQSLGFTDGLTLSNWEDLVYEASLTEPTTEAEEGTLWFNDDFLADVMVNDGDQWKGYRNAFPTTDPNGVQIAGSPPLTQSDGTPLVENDLWIDGTQLEDYPQLYRWRTALQEWELVDNTDQTSPFGVVFADARWNDTGQVDGSQDPAHLIQSDFVDPDAPDPRTYPAGILLFNTRASTYNVKEWRPDYFEEYVGFEESPGVQYDVGLFQASLDTITLENVGRWVTASGNKVDGSPYMGRQAQRRMVVQAMAAAIISNQDIRSEATFFNLLAAPGYPELIEELITLNTDKKEIAFIVGDTPARLAPTGTAINNWANNTAAAPSTGDEGLTVRNTYVGLYYPWALSTNTDGNEVVVPPSTVAMRTLAFNDQVAFPWFAPAGFNRGLVTNASSVGYITSEGEYRATIFSPGQRDTLYLNDINPIAFIPGRGLVVYGQKSLHPVDSALDRVNVVRLINYLRYNFDIIAKPFLFEPNDRMTRDQVVSVFERFMGNLVSLRAVYDFAVVCDESNNTPERIDRNELWIDVAIQPVKAIEFIYIPIRIRNTGEDLTNFLPAS